MAEIPKWACRSLNPESIKKIEEAVAQAETRTTGEIVPMIVRRSSSTGHVAPLLILAGLCIVLASEAFVRVSEHAWGLWAEVGLILLVSGVGVVLSRLSFVQRWFTLDADLDQQVRMRAVAEFHEYGLSRTQGGTGILLLTSLMEREAVVLADKSISDQLPPETWAEVIQTLIQGVKEDNLATGYVRAIAQCGEILARRFPNHAHNPDEMRNHLVLKT